MGISEVLTVDHHRCTYIRPRIAPCHPSKGTMKAIFNQLAATMRALTPISGLRVFMVVIPVLNVQRLRRRSMRI